MSADMPDFKLSFRGQRKRADERGAQGQIDRMAEEIRALDEAAQRAARNIGQSAAELRGRTGGAQGSDDDLLGELAAAIAGRSDTIRNECGRLSALLERARRLVDEGPPAEEPDWAVTAAALDGAPEPWREASADGGSPVQAGSQPLRLTATQMAISGSSRAEIEQRLRDELEPGEIGSLLDEIFGDPRAGASR